MTDERTWPKPGDTLVHRFRNKPGRIEAKVTSVNRDTGRVTVKIGNTTYSRCPLPPPPWRATQPTVGYSGV